MVNKLKAAVLLSTLWPTLAFAAWPSGSSHHQSVTFNEVTMGATCNGSGNDDAAFAANAATIRADSRVIAGADVVVVIPTGAHCVFGSCSGVYFGNGLSGTLKSNWTIVMTGATMTAAGGSGCLQMGNSSFQGVFAGSKVEQKFQTANIGDSCVTMVTASDAGLYPVGRMVIAAAIDLQGSGFPPNFGVFEYLRVLSANAGTGVVCFITKLANFYKSTWIGGGNCAGFFCGGPGGRLYLMDITWQSTITVIGGTWNWNGNMILVAQNEVFYNTVFNGSGTNAPSCIYPSLVQNFIFNNVTLATCGQSVDKEIGNYIINGGSVDHLVNSSSSFHNEILNNTTANRLEGAAQNTICNNSTISQMSFANVYGNPLSFTGTGCKFPNGGPSFGAGPGFCSTGFTNPNCLSTYLGSGNFQWGGVGSFPVGNPPGFLTPGTVMIFKGNGFANAGWPFTLTDNSCSGGGVDSCFGGTGTIATNLTLAAPLNPPVYADPSLGETAQPDQMRNWACNNCTGSAFAVDLSQAPAQHQPLATYSSLTFTCTANLAPGMLDINSPGYGGSVIGLWGTVTINVSRADTGPHSAPLLMQLNGFSYQLVNQSTGATSFWPNNFVDLKVAGVRTITPTTVTNAQPNDTLSAPVAGVNTWVALGGTFIANVPDLTAEAAAQCPVVTYTWQVTR